MSYIKKWRLWISYDGTSCFLKDELNFTQSNEKNANERLKVDASLTAPSGSGTRAGLFRTPISGGVQSATSAHGLPRPALAVRNLMEQVRLKLHSFYYCLI